MASYWSQVLSHRINRRRALAASGATAFGAALLSACGGTTGNDGFKDESGLLSKPADTTNKAVPGGTFVRNVSEPASIDPLTNNASTAHPHILPMYSLLIKYGLRNDGKPPGADDLKGDAAESWEFSPDGLQLTLKLRANHKFDPRPPTSGRAMTSADVKYSWDKLVASSVFAVDLAAAKGGGAPIETLTYPDARTVVMKLAYPYTALPDLLAFSRLWVAPVEAEDKYNPKAEARGSGPFFLEKWDPSLGLEYKRNPDWYEKGRPFLDGMSYKIIAEYASGLAQFEAGNLWSFGVNPPDLLRVKRDHPEMVMLQEFKTGGPNGHYWQFSQKDDSPFRDVRVRRAASMAIDRDLYIEVIEGLEQFQKAGLAVQTYWHSHLPAQGLSWLDPKGNQLGEGAKNFQYNPTESQKLLSAAGYDKSKTPIQFWSRSRTGRADQFAEVTAAMLSDAGMNLEHQVLDNNSSWRQMCQAYEPSGTAFNGFCYATTSAFNDENYFAGVYTPEGKFRFSSKDIPGISDTVRKVRTELDLNKQMEMMKQLQRDLAVQMLNLQVPGIALGYTLRQPWLKNHGVFTWQGGSQDFSSSREFTEFWYDASAKKA